MEGGLRLNLGGGDRRIKGFVNVDLPVRRKNPELGNYDYSTEPEIVADVRSLPLPDGVVDEAMAIHVIEHLLPWEAQATVNEWVRVLKPGAKLAIECPSLDKIIHLAQIPGLPPDFVHWGLYGDPRYKDPLMLHRWCYTERHLVKVMAHAGLVNLAAEPPLFHQIVRDMRVVGFKPDSLLA